MVWAYYFNKEIMEGKKKISPNNPNQTENQGGRPEKYTPEELLIKSQEYFDFLDDKWNRINKWINWKLPRPKTLSWLCLWLWVAKDYISEKAKDDRFSETIKRIRLVVENNIEEWILLNIYNPASWMFNLKNNFDWKEKTENKNENTNVNYEAETSDELKNILKDNWLL